MHYFESDLFWIHYNQSLLIRMLLWLVFLFYYYVFLKLYEALK
jgi:hypothetical protein